jgi:nitrate reductase (cytochrome), electron transfer subunit
MTRLLSAVLAIAAIATTVLAVPPATAADAVVKLQTFRGDTPIEKTTEAEMYKPTKDAKPLPRDYVQQPPLIPHSIRDYQITKNYNKCMDCHAWSKTKDSGATKVSVTHFKTREGQELSNISPRRYFCNACHVPQADAKPLVQNTFKPGAGM